MWVLLSGSDVKYAVIPRTEPYVVSRKELLPQGIPVAHPSVSGKHANIYVRSFAAASDVGNPEVIPKIEIQDNSSRGTFLNNERMKKGALTPLKHGDVLQFGKSTETFMVHYEAMVVVGSQLPPATVSSLQKTMISLGGHFLKKWSPQCTHLVMPCIEITIKLLQALCNQSYIVKLSFFTATLERRKLQDRVDEALHLPPKSDKIARMPITLSPSGVRKSLFKGLKFVFATEAQAAKNATLVKAGGGSILLMDSAPSNDLSSSMVYVKQENRKAAPEIVSKYSRIEAELTREGLRMVPSSEITKALIYASLDRFCNPDQTAKPSQSQSQFRGTQASQIAPAPSLATGTPVNHMRSEPSIGESAVSLPINESHVPQKVSEEEDRAATPEVVEESVLIAATEKSQPASRHLQVNTEPKSPRRSPATSCSPDNRHKSPTTHPKSRPKSPSTQSKPPAALESIPESPLRKKKQISSSKPSKRKRLPSLEPEDDNIDPGDDMDQISPKKVTKVAKSGKASAPGKARVEPVEVDEARKIDKSNKAPEEPAAAAAAAAAATEVNSIEKTLGKRQKKAPVVLGSKLSSREPTLSEKGVRSNAKRKRRPPSPQDDSSSEEEIKEAAKLLQPERQTKKARQRRDPPAKEVFIAPSKALEPVHSEIGQQAKNVAVYEEEIPSVITESKSLVVRRPAVIQKGKQKKSAEGPNFKKFRKVQGGHIVAPKRVDVRLAKGGHSDAAEFLFAEFTAKEAKQKEAREIGDDAFNGTVFGVAKKVAKRPRRR